MIQGSSRFVARLDYRGEMFTEEFKNKNKFSDFYFVFVDRAF